jgi:ATP-dependent helicase/nuclease subunit A
MAHTEAQRSAIEKDASLCVTAGAGTGKTKVLVERYIRLLEKVPSSRNLLALTFTEKAAAEMLERVRRELSGRSDARGREMLEDLHWASITTFHAFCAKVLRQFPLEAGVDPGFQVAEGPELDMVLSETIEDLLSTQDEEVRGALRRIVGGIGERRLRELLVELYGQRDEVSPALQAMLCGDAEANWLQAEKEWQASVVRSLRAAPDAMQAARALLDLADAKASEADKGTKFLKAARPALLQMLGDDSQEAYAGILAFGSTGGAANMGSKKSFSDAELQSLRSSFVTLRGAIELADEECGGLSESDGDPAAAVAYLRDLALVNSAMQQLAWRHKRQRGEIDFDDMISAVRDLFRAHPEIVRKHFTERFRYILVDETQDTDKAQLDIVKAIAGGMPRAKDRVFVVGDPKQSIYLFRGVDVALFKHTRGYVEECLKGETLHLDVNHRSAPQLVGFANHVFSRAMDQERRPWEFRYQPVKVSSYRSRDEGSVQLMIAPGSGRGVERKMAEAQALAWRISSFLTGKEKVFWDGKAHLPEGRTPRYGDMAVLLRGRTNLHFYEHCLREAGIPYRVHAGIGFYARQEVMDMYSLLAFLNDRGDDVSLYGVLRSPYFGMDDGRLFRLAKGRKGGLFQAMKASNDAEVAKAVVLLEDWLDYSRRETASDLMARVIGDSGIYAVYGGTSGGRQAIANLEKMQEMARDAAAKGMEALPDWVEALRRSIMDQASEGEAQLDLDGEDAVTIMTVHASKGLEFPIVLLPELDVQPPPLEEAPIRFDAGLGLGVRIPDPESAKLLPSPGMRRIEAVLKLKHKAEARRLFYVAVTRAKDHLVLSVGEPKWKEEEGGLEKAKSNWDVLVSALPLDEATCAGPMAPYEDEGRGYTMTIIHAPLGGEKRAAEESVRPVPEWLRQLAS